MSRGASVGAVLRAVSFPTVIVVTVIALTAIALGPGAAHAVAIKDIVRETPQQREARDQLLVGNHAAVVALLSDAALKTRKRTAQESALLGRALTGLGRVAEARATLTACTTKPECALTFGEIELQVGDRRAALRILGAAFKRYPKHLQIRVAFGAALYAVGEGYQARQLLDPLADLYAAREVTGFADQIAVARSLALNGFFKDANQVLADASEAVADRHERKLVEITWAQLFLSKFNFRDADVGFRKALKIDPGNVPAIVGMCRIDLDSDHAPRKAKKRLDTALKHAPTDPRLLSLRAEVALVDEDLPAARAYLALALKSSPRHRDVLAVLYATCRVADDKRCAQKALKTSLKVNAHDPLPHLVAARYLEAGHRYDLVLTELKSALKRDPDNAEAHAALGMSYARLADDKRAFAHLDTAFRTDGYNVRTANVLNVLYDGVLKHMVLLKGEFVDLRVHRKHRQALERTVLPFLQESYEILAKKYGMTPKQPLRVEIFPTSEQFSVRTVGLPQLGAHAVGFGHLITSRSPTEKPFNWKMVLHHEMAHVFHIQATDGRVPRWLTEGLAMMESVWLDPRYHMRMERRAYDRLKAGKLAKVRTFNLAFSQARSMQEIIDAYYQAMKLTRYLSDTYGFPKVAKLVAAHKSGKPTTALVKQVLGVTAEQLDANFATWLGTHLARFDRDFHPTPETIHLALKGKNAATSKDPSLVALHQAMVALKRGNAAEAQRLLEGAAKQVMAGKGTVRDSHQCTIGYLLADLALAKRDWRTLAAMTGSLVREPACDGVRQRLLLARALRASGKDRGAEVLHHLGKAAEIDPKDVAVKRLWLASLPKDAPEAERRRLMREILALSPNEAVMGMRLAALAWRRLGPAVGLDAGEAIAATPRTAATVLAAARPTTAAPKPVVPASKPVLPASKPVLPASKPVLPASKQGNTGTTQATTLTATERAALVRDVKRGADQLEETVPHSFQQALWEARSAVATGALKMSLPAYRIAATRARDKQHRRTAWCELATIAKRANAKDALGEATRRCKAER